MYTRAPNPGGNYASTEYSKYRISPTILSACNSVYFIAMKDNIFYGGVIELENACNTQLNLHKLYKRRKEIIKDNQMQQA